MARAQWISLEQLNTMPDPELRDLIAESYQLVWERLPKKRQQELQSGGKAAAKKASPASKTKKAKPAGKARAKKAAQRG
jgi:hypothetical protein